MLKRILADAFDIMMFAAIMAIIWLIVTGVILWTTSFWKLLPW